LVDGLSTSNLRGPSAACLSDNSLVVSYLIDSASTSIRVKHLDHDLNELNVENFADDGSLTDTAVTTKLHALSDGGYILAYNNENIYGRVYDSDSILQGNEFQVSLGMNYQF